MMSMRVIAGRGRGGRGGSSDSQGDGQADHRHMDDRGGGPLLSDIPLHTVRERLR